MREEPSFILLERIRKKGKEDFWRVEPTLET